MVVWVCFSLNTFTCSRKLVYSASPGGEAAALIVCLGLVKSYRRCEETTSWLERLLVLVMLLVDVLSLDGRGTRCVYGDTGIYIARSGYQGRNSTES